MHHEDDDGTVGDLGWCVVTSANNSPYMYCMCVCLFVDH